MSMNIVLILLFSINGISCLKNGMPMNSLSSYTNCVATIWRHEVTTPRLLCSGTIITPSYIITAGHCVYNVKNYEIYVTAGRFDLRNTISRPVLSIYLHNNFERLYNPLDPHTEYWLNDLAILNLAYELTLSPHIRPIPSNFWKKKNFPVYSYIMGWSNIVTDMINESMTMQWADTMILANTCNDVNNPLLPNEVYAIITTGTATLDATDIGNVLMADESIVGIIVAGRDPTGSIMNVLALQPYQDFIDYTITGGIVSIKNYNFRDVITIWESGHFRCGGFMIHDHHIVTAGHCVMGVNKDHLLVAFSNLGTLRINSASEWTSVESIEIHPLYQSIYIQNFAHHIIENDIAVLKVKSALPWNPLVSLMELPRLYMISVNKPCKILRWIHRTIKNEVSKELKESFVTIVNSGKNEESGFYAGAEQFWVNGIYGWLSVTEEDIGNPVIFENNLIGMIIAVDFSNKAKPGPVTCLKLFSYANFIEEVINKE